METKSKKVETKKVVKTLKIYLAVNGITATALAEELGVSRGAIYMAIYQRSGKGVVSGWFRDNLNIDLKTIDLKETA